MNLKQEQRATIANYDLGVLEARAEALVNFATKGCCESDVEMAVADLLDAAKALITASRDLREEMVK